MSRNKDTEKSHGPDRWSSRISSLVMRMGTSAGTWPLLFARSITVTCGRHLREKEDIRSVRCISPNTNERRILTAQGCSSITLFPSASAILFRFFFLSSYCCFFFSFLSSFYVQCLSVSVLSFVRLLLLTPETVHWHARTLLPLWLRTHSWTDFVSRVRTPCLSLFFFLLDRGIWLKNGIRIREICACHSCFATFTSDCEAERITRLSMVLATSVFLSDSPVTKTKKYVQILNSSLSMSFRESSEGLKKLILFIIVYIFLFTRLLNLAHKLSKSDIISAV